MIPLLSRWWSALLIAVSTAACDLPPDTPFETESDSTEWESDPGWDSESDSDSLPETGQPAPTCAEAVFCIVNSPDAVFSCFDGLDETNRAAAMQLALCLSTNCIENGADLLNLALCTATECGNEIIDCTNASVTEILP